MADPRDKPAPGPDGPIVDPEPAPPEPVPDQAGLPEQSPAAPAVTGPDSVTVEEPALDTEATPDPDADDEAPHFMP